MLGIEAKKPWEYTASNPIRSVTFSSVVSFPYFLLNCFSSYLSYYCHFELTPKVLLIAPRLFMAVLSLVADYSIFQIASICYVRPWQCLEVFAGSYIMLVYATRTFSNSVELMLQCVLLWRICLSMVDSSKIIRMESVLQGLYEEAEGVKERVKLSRLKSKLGPYNYTDSFLISVVVTYGTFVRPTFIIYSFIPVAYWLQRGVVTGELSFYYFNLRCLSLLPGVLITVFVCILADSFYYHSLSLKELLTWNVTASSFTITPVNFIIYNFDVKSLEISGLHPFYLHLGVNVPLLHGILGLIGLFSVSRYITSLFVQSMSKKPRVYSMATMLLATFFVPIVVLSLFPHQEPRFLLSTLPPLVILHSDKISLFSITKFRFTRHFFFLMWNMWNIICVITFGFLHQGGVTKAMFSIHDYVSSNPSQGDVHVFFAYLYSPPTFLLMRETHSFGTAFDGRKYMIPRRVQTYNVGRHLSIQQILNQMVHIFHHENGTKEPEFILCLPGSISSELMKAEHRHLKIQRISQLYGHVTLEDPPDLSLDKASLTDDCMEVCQFLKKLSQFTVDIFSVTINSHNVSTVIFNTSGSYSVKPEHDEL